MTRPSEPSVSESAGSGSAPAASRAIIGVFRGIGTAIVQADDAFLGIVGYTRAEFDAGSMDWQAMTPPEFLHLDEAGMQQARSSGGFTLPYQKEFVRKDGSRAPVLLCCAFLPQPTDHWMGYVVDLSPPATRHLDAGPVNPVVDAEPLPQLFYSRLVEELTRERARMVAMLDSTEAVIWAIDPSLTLMSANMPFRRSIRRAFGRDVSFGESVLSVYISEAERSEWRGWYERALAGDHFTVRGRTRSDDEREVHLEHVFSPITDPQRGIIGATVVSQDVTTRMRAEDALRSSEAQFRTLVAASPLGIFLTDQTGGCIFANPRVCAVWQLTPTEMLGTGFVRRLHPDDASAVMDRWARAIESGVELDMEYRLLLDGDEVRFVHVMMAPVRDGERLTGFVGTVDDDTDRRATANRMRQREKMESLGTLAGGIAHDFNNMLAVVIGYSDLALAEVERGSAVYDDLAQIRVASLRARDLVRQILTFSRRTEGEHGVVEFRSLVLESLRMLRATLPSSVALISDITDETVFVRADAAALQQVILNLSSNAAYVMRETGGELHVTLERRPGHGVREAELRVRDTGPGMTSQVRERLFEPFFTTKPLGEGTGMGLAVVHGTIASVGGRITVQSAPGHGATFAVTLPLVEAAPEVAPEPPHDQRGSGRILLVEDEPALRRFAAQALQRAGYDVTQCANGEEAIAALSLHAYDLVMSDVTMPRMGGAELVRAIATRGRTIPTILMTGFSHTVTEAEAERLGAARLLQKPLSANDLVAAAHAVLLKSPV